MNKKNGPPEFDNLAPFRQRLAALIKEGVFSDVVSSFREANRSSMQTLSDARQLLAALKAHLIRL
ncbi:hypothetical protein GB927_012950 [Shinella sp. CPCC 100929]|uniref:Uncharacterized protein n=1 Tax=Shinella lacus TaxID=2654216 RepID=A0ABT1R6Y9_9HYPH|nr:hypothetical protein [Shinella lacus]MCQ4630954.1 hypothetical protein [Shinella lacus]